MLLKIAIGALLMVMTTAIHTIGMMMALQLIKRQEGAQKSRWLRKTNIHLVSVIVLMMFFVSLAEVLIWACTYLALSASEGLEQAVYFSMVTFTTLGYGDVLLDERWRLLASFEAANGIIMFGWTTAIVIAAVQRIYFRE
ncbi:MAG: potassium channel family protein [Desulfobacterales bacterium]